MQVCTSAFTAPKKQQRRQTASKGKTKLTRSSSKIFVERAYITRKKGEKNRRKAKKRKEKKSINRGRRQY